MTNFGACFRLIDACCGGGWLCAGPRWRQTCVGRIGRKRQIIKRLKPIWANGGNHGTLVTWVGKAFGWKLEILEKRESQNEFQILPKRWVVVRTFG
jgi:hypothetical protein